MSSENNELTRVTISNAISKLQELDFHDATASRKACIEVIGSLRTVNVPDADIETIVQHYTGLRPSRVKEYLRVEESDADKFADLVGRYGLPVRKRIVPPLPSKREEKQEANQK